MTNVVNSIGFDLERVHTGLIVYLVDLWISGHKTPLQKFLKTLDEELQGYTGIRAEKEYKNIDLVLCDQSKPIIAIEMKVHNHESRVAEKQPRSERNYQTVEYPKRVKDACKFLYVTLGVGEFFRREPYGKTHGEHNVCKIGLDKFCKAVDAIPNPDPVVEAWAQTLRDEKKFRRECREGKFCQTEGKDIEKYNLYFLGFLREKIENKELNGCELDLTVYRVSQDTILNIGVECFEKHGAYCYMEINSNGKLNLKANLEQLSNEEAKKEYVKEAKDHYLRLMNNSCAESGRASKTLKKTKTVMSFDVGIRKQDKLFTYEEGLERTAEKVNKVVRTFLADNQCG